MTSTQLPGSGEKMCPTHCWIMYGMTLRPYVAPSWIPERHRKDPVK